MCGIAGVIKKGPITPYDRTIVRRMTKSLVHRGPDSAGWYENDGVLLGVRRLSIIDVVGGDQPLFNEDKSKVLIGNGEIYNFKEIRKSLEKKGHRFRTRSDMETICHLYEDYGIRANKHLRGMFAYVLYDRPGRKIYLVRDRIGEKPLFYYRQGDRLVFASEMKGIIQALPKSARGIDPLALDLYLHYQFVPEPLTILGQIKKLPPAHYLEIDLETKSTKIVRYWDIETKRLNEGERPEVIVRTELEEIGRIIGRSEVPVGISLSGGIDSSTVAAIIANFSENRNITHAISVGYAGEPPFDERKYARIVARQLGLTLHEVEIKKNDVLEQYAEYVYAADEPIADISGYALYRIMKEAHRHGIKVMLSGIGGDELFWGYPWVRETVRESLRKQELVRSKSLASLLKRFIMRKQFQQYQVSKPNQLIFYDRQPDFEFFHALGGSLYTPQLQKQIPQDNALSIFTQQDWGEIPETIMRLKIKTWLVSNAINLSDRLSMANSIELRLPLVDYKLVEQAFSINRSVKRLYEKPPKLYLKRAVEGLLPKDIVHREKQAFRPPTREWIEEIFENQVGKVSQGYLVDHKLIDRDEVRRLRKQPIPGLMLNLWYKLFRLEAWCRLVLEDQALNSF